jgi:hypothetical protein
MEATRKTREPSTAKAYKPRTSTKISMNKTQTTPEMNTLSSVTGNASIC